MNLIKPYQATVKLNNFINRVERLQENNYSNPRFRTYDLSQLKNELPKIILLCSIAVHNKNDNSTVIEKTKECYYTAKNIKN